MRTTKNLRLSISSQYGFDRNWMLEKVKIRPDKTEIVVKQWYLGQDVKFCTRVLGCDPSYVADRVGRDLSDKKTRKRLIQFILDTLELDSKKLNNLETWELCAQ
jgi:hypothetical protein